jgi:hypothetical protein
MVWVGLVMVVIGLIGVSGVAAGGSTQPNAAPLLLVAGIVLTAWGFARSGDRQREAKRALPQAPPPGWYRDPDGGVWKRWWDGEQWTEHRQDPGAKGATPPSLREARDRKLR